MMRITTEVIEQVREYGIGTSEGYVFIRDGFDIIVMKSDTAAEVLLSWRQLNEMVEGNEDGH